MKIFVAGATGAVGLPLVRVLCALGHQVTGMTRAGAGVSVGNAVERFFEQGCSGMASCGGMGKHVCHRSA
ncbi:hypothetical protein [Paraburkholderia lacunae]|uniref:hypothetical protein n=1 Tax=Paraburkholderia lacunae TaxID=2211104 RepID=UPI001AD82FDD|nr:hypothetical protein [Paraburkholderia lacunae]